MKLFSLLLMFAATSFVYAQPSASFQWVAQMGGPSYDYAMDVAVDASGNVYTTGYFRNTVDFDPGAGTFTMTSAGINDVFITKMDASGNLVWAIQIGGAEDDFGRGIGVDAAGNVYVSGYFKNDIDFDPGVGTYYTNPSNPVNEHMFLLKLNSNGHFIWAREIHDMGPSSPPRTLSSYTDAAGNTYLTSCVYGPGIEDFMVCKYDNSGVFGWKKIIGGASGDRSYSVYSDATGVFITGSFSSTTDFDPGAATYSLTSDGWEDAFVLKLTAGGDFVWARQFASASNLYGYGVTTDLTGNVYVTGSFQFTADFDPGVAFFEMTSAGSSDIFLVKLNSSGDFIWAKQFGPGGFNNLQGGYAVKTDSNQDVYLAGLYHWTIDMNPGAGTDYLPSYGGNDIFVAKYDPQGNYIWAKGMGSSGDFDYAAALEIDPMQNVYIAGNFQLTVDFNPGYQVHNVTSFGQTDAYVLKLSQCNNTGLTINETVCDLYTLNGVAYDSSGTFYQYFVNSQGCDSIITINLTVNTSPVIISSPDTINKCINGWVDINVDAVGTAPLSYQWYQDGNLLTNDTNFTFHVNGLQASHDGFYTCEITNSCGSVTTDGTALQVIQITVNPGSDTAFCNNNPVQLLATATSNYPAVSGSFTYLWSPPEGLSATNIPNPTAQPMGDTQYQIVANDQNNCPGMAFLNVYSHTPVSIMQQPQPLLNLCLNDMVMINFMADGSAPVTYQWLKDGSPIPLATANTYQITSATLQDEGIYTCVVSNYCNNISTNNITINVIDLTLTASSDTGMCKGQTASLSANASSNHPAQSGTLNYIWSPGTGLNTVQGQNVTANPNTSVTYTVAVTDNNGCSAQENVSVDVYLPFSDEEICLVTVDTLSWKNKIMWEKTQGAGTIGYNVYKEVASNVYSSIGFVPFADPAEYVDLYSQPESFANRYKISVVDTCGNESDKSYYHNTMNLTIAAFGSTMGLSWTPYSDESGTFMPALYDIYRGTNPSNMTYLASIPGTQTSYNDVNVFTVYHYIVGVTKPGGCNTAKADIVSFSNRKDNTDFIGIGENLYMAGTIEISPNPMSTSATLTIPNSNFELRNSNFELLISDLTGKVVRVISPSSILRGPQDDSWLIERGDLKPGIYFVELKADRVYRGKLVVE